MRKYNKFYKRIRLFTVYRVTGYNINTLLNYCKRNSITLYDVKKIDEKHTEITVKFGDRKKFFAIAQDLCYNNKNVIKIKERGLLYPLFFLVRNLGFVLGAIVLCVGIAMADDVIFEIQYFGSGSIFQNEVKDYLLSRGISEFTRFSDIDIKSLEDDIVSSNDNISFAGVKKEGNKLIIRIEPSDSESKIKNPVNFLNADATGIIETIKVYRGTAVKCVGDVVKKGELIVDGYAIIKDQMVHTNVVAYVSLVVAEQYTYMSNENNDEVKAELFALEHLKNKEPLDLHIEKTLSDKKYVYVVTVKYRHIITT